MHTLPRCAAALALLLTLPLSATAQDAGPAQRIDRDDDAPAVPTPLAVGNSWTYNNSDSNSIITETIEEVRTFDGQDWYRLHTIDRDPDAKGDQAVLYEGDIWLAHLDGVEVDANGETNEQGQTVGVTNISPMYLYPAEVGDTYEPYGDDEGIQIEVTSIDEVVRTDAGDFTCIVYRETDKEVPGHAYLTYISPGVGVVRIQSVDGDDVWTSDLVEYTLVGETDE